MLIQKKLPQGHIYPQITQAPINNYVGPQSNRRVIRL